MRYFSGSTNANSASVEALDVHAAPKLVDRVHVALLNNEPPGKSNGVEWPQHPRHFLSTSPVQDDLCGSIFSGLR
jgi:hypothetical protein